VALKVTELGEDKTSRDIVSEIKEKFGESVAHVSNEAITTLLVDKAKVFEVALTLKEKGFDHLSDVTVVDYIKEKEFELIYHLWSHRAKRRVMLKTRVQRSEALMKSFTSLWSSAQMHERECHEMFGLNFDGNPDLSPLLLEDWDEIPPLRKDFDSRKYVLEKFYGGERE